MSEPGVTKAALDALGVVETIVATGDDLSAAPWPATTERRRLGEWIVARGRQMGASIKTRKKDEPSPSRRELDDRCEMVMRDYIAVAADIEDLTACRERR